MESNVAGTAFQLCAMACIRSCPGSHRCVYRTAMRIGVRVAVLLRLSYQAVTAGGRCAIMKTASELHSGICAC